MNMGLLCDGLSKGWYPTNLIRQIRNTSEENDSIYVYTFEQEQEAIDDVSTTPNLGPLTYPLVMIKQIIEDDLDVLHIQFEFLMTGSVLSPVVMPFLLIFGRLYGTKIITTLHGPIHESGELQQLSALSPYKSLSLFLPAYFISIITLLLLLSHKVIVHGDTFKNRIVSAYPVSESKLTVIPHGVADGS